MQAKVPIAKLVYNKNIPYSQISYDELTTLTLRANESYTFFPHMNYLINQDCTLHVKKGYALRFVPSPSLLTHGLLGIAILIGSDKRIQVICAGNNNRNIRLQRFDHIGSIQFIKRYKEIKIDHKDLLYNATAQNFLTNYRINPISQTKIDSFQGLFSLPPFTQSNIIPFPKNDYNLQDQFLQISQS
jgi:dUTPase